MQTRYLVRAIQTALLLSATHAAAAQTTDTPKKSAIESIVVTGQKIDRSLHETAASVVVVTKQQIEDQNIEGLYDVIERSANVNGDLEDGRFSIRGIDIYNVSGGGNSFLASVYADGAPLPELMIREGGFSTWDVSQVEILRGPQSTLQGRNALAGAIIMRTETPSYERDGKIRLTLGEDGKQGLAFAGGGELVDNQLAFRLSGETLEQDGANDNVTLGEHSNAKKNDTYRAKFLYEPSAIEDLSLLFSYTHNSTQSGASWTDSTTAERAGRREILTDTADVYDTDNDLYSIEVNYQLNDDWSMSAVSSYLETDYGYVRDGDRTPQALSVSTRDRLDESFTQEFRFVYDGESVTGIVGAYYSNLEVNDKFGGSRTYTLESLGVPTLLVAPVELGGLGLPPAFAQQILGHYDDFDPVTLVDDRSDYQKVENMALFADAQIKLDDHWEINAGIRFDRETQEYSGNAKLLIDNEDQMPNPANPALAPTSAAIIGGLNAALYSMLADASQDSPLNDDTFSEILPKLGVSYHWNNELTTSLLVQRGYRSGGVGVNTAEAENFTYDAEYTWNYELSLRSIWLDGDLSANANLFYVDWEDQQVNIQLGSNTYDTETRNAGESVVKGFDTELFYQASGNLALYAGLGYAKTEFKKFPIDIEPGDLSGRSFAKAPEWTANAGATYTADNGIFTNINVNYAGKSKEQNNPWSTSAPGEADFDPEIRARTLVNAKVGYQWDKFQLNLTATNLFDKEYITAPDTGDGRHTYGAARQISLQLQADF